MEVLGDKDQEIYWNNEEKLLGLMIQKGGEGENINIDYGHLPEEVLL